MRCFFNLVKNGAPTIRDQEGVEILDVEEARVEAKRAIEEMRREDPAALADWTGWRVEVVDSSGTVLLSFALDNTKLGYSSMAPVGVLARPPLLTIN